MIVESRHLSERDSIGTRPQASRSPTPLSRNPSPEGPLILSTVEGSSGGAAQYRQSVTVILTPKRGPFSPVIPRPREESRICPLALLSVSPPFPIEQRNRAGGRDSTYPGRVGRGVPSCVKGDGAVGSPRQVTCTP